MLVHSISPKFNLTKAMKNQFTPEGIAAWQQSLLPLNQQQLQELAAQITANFKVWLANTFILEPSQLDYLKSINASFLQLLAAQLAFAVANKLTIKLNKPQSATLRGTKLIRDNSALQANADGQGNVNASGEVVIEILYG